MEISHIYGVIFVSFIIGYITSTILLANLDNINQVFYYTNNNLNKFYGSFFVAFIVGLYTLIINKNKISRKSFINNLIIILVFILIFYYLILKQVFVDEKHFLKTMIENNGENIKIAKRIVEKENISEETKNFAKELIERQEKEIEDFNKKLKTL